MPPQNYSQPEPQYQSQSNDGNIYERIEEIAENLIDEKWDDLIAEVKKVIEWTKVYEYGEDVKEACLKQIEEYIL